MTALSLVESPKEVGSVAFNFESYVASLARPEALDRQQGLAAAYDLACRSLIGPNDVQKDGNREFKCKSAWRKLARYFDISIVARPEDVRLDMLPSGEWVAIASATAVAPWGQRSADFGACGSDEESGRRTISYADAIATAMTRASNRAISNLIAMGEVSAEEMERRGPVARRGQAKRAPAELGNGPNDNGTTTLSLHEANAVAVKGKTLGEMSDSQVEKVHDWARGVIDKEGESDRMVRIATACTLVLESRHGSQGEVSEAEEGYLGELSGGA